MKKISVIVGSLRQESFNLKIAKNLIALAPASLQMEIVEIGKLPLYNQDLDPEPPQQWIEFRKKIKENEGVLFVTPEYNRSIPGVLKNAIDVGSRPYGQSAWAGKPGAVISVSPGMIGGFGANHHLRQTLVFLDVPVMQQPEAYIGGVSKILDENGELNSDSTRDLLVRFLESYSNWVNLILPTARPKLKAAQ